MLSNISLFRKPIIELGSNKRHTLIKTSFSSILMENHTANFMRKITLTPESLLLGRNTRFKMGYQRLSIAGKIRYVVAVVFATPIIVFSRTIKKIKSDLFA